MEETKVTIDTQGEATNAVEKEEERSLEERFKELQGRYKDLEASNVKLKSANDKLCSENANWKRENREKLSEVERTKLEKEELDQVQKQRIEELEGQIKKGQARQRYIEYGFDAKEAEDLSSKELSGDMDSILKALKAKQDIEIKNAQEKWMNDQPQIKVGGKTENDDDVFANAFNKGLRG